MRPINLDEMMGKKFGRWTPIESAGRDRHGRRLLLCKCDCGTVRKVIAHVIYSDMKRQSCGCKRAEFIKTFSSKHGLSRSPEYRIWIDMRCRCANPKLRSYKYYGAVGIKVCERWNDFENFLEDMGKRPDGYLIDRENPHGDYEPSNCRWVTAKESARNLRKTIRLTIDGITKNYLDWRDHFRLEVSNQTLRYRLLMGWDVHDALFTPSRPK